MATSSRTLRQSLDVSADAMRLQVVVITTRTAVTIVVPVIILTILKSIQPLPGHKLGNSSVLLPEKQATRNVAGTRDSAGARLSQGFEQYEIGTVVWHLHPKVLQLARTCI